MRKRPIPKPTKEGEDIYLLMADAKGRSRHAVHYVASHDFMKAMRVCDTGIENFDRLWGEKGFELTLLSPSQRKLHRC